jgi:hypothetical protein
VLTEEDISKVLDEEDESDVFSEESYDSLFDMDEEEFRQRFGYRQCP